MKNFKNLLFYIITIGGLSMVMYFIVQKGATLEIGKMSIPDVTTQTPSSSWEQLKDTYHHNVTHPLAILLLQIIAIITVSRVFAYFCKKIGQPTVIGEILAGIFLGPSLIGMFFPEFSAFLFPKQSLPNLQFLSQIGLILFMFIVGMELDLKILKNRAHEAVVISHVSIIFPFALGIGLAFFTYQTFAPANISFLSFCLFVGISMSITAFPVLARIVQERGLTKTKLGAIVITCAAADDITAWCLLAAVIAIVKAGSMGSSIYTILLAIAYVFIMIKVVQPFLKRMGDLYSNKEGLSKPIVAVFFLTLIGSAYATEVIGIHALFGAFMAGVIMPPNINFRNIFIEKVEDVSLVLLLPLFFVFTGLRTQIGLLNEPYLWQICAFIVAVAVVGKFVGSAIAAKFVGQNWRESLMIGALMNTRGLMELIVLNIGYDIGVLTSEVFSMMVIMALVTTFMTGPALDLINKFLPEKKTPTIPDEIENASKYSILISFGSPLTGKTLLGLAHSFIKKAPGNARIAALHLSLGNELNQFNTEEYERDSFHPLITEAQKLNLPVTTMFKPTQDIDKEITETANIGNFDLLLVGIGHSVFEGTLLGKILGFTTRIINPERLYDTITGRDNLFHTIFDDRTKQIVKSSKVPVGILIDKNLDTIQNVFIPIFSVGDSFLLAYAQKIISNNEARVIIMDMNGLVKQNAALKEAIRSLEQIAPNHIALYGERKIEKEFLIQQDLMLISLNSWKTIIEKQITWLSDTPSVLIIRP